MRYLLASNHETYRNISVSPQKLNDDFQKIHSLINSEKKIREETQEGILEMIKIMKERMKNDLDLEIKIDQIISLKFTHNKIKSHKEIIHLLSVK